MRPAPLVTPIVSPMLLNAASYYMTVLGSWKYRGDLHGAHILEGDSEETINS